MQMWYIGMLLKPRGLKPTRKKKNEFELKNGYLCREIAVVLLLSGHQSKYRPLFVFLFATLGLGAPLLISIHNFGDMALFFSLGHSNQTNRILMNGIYGNWIAQLKLVSLDVSNEISYASPEILLHEFPGSRMEERLLKTERLFAIIFKTWTFRVYRSIYHTPHSSAYSHLFISIYDLCCDVVCCVTAWMTNQFFAKTTLLHRTVQGTIECEKWFLFVFLLLLMLITVNTKKRKNV